MRTVAVDIDDVVTRHASGWVAFSNEQFGTNFTEDDYHEGWEDIWGVDTEEVERRKQLFFSDDILGGFGLVEEADVALCSLAASERLIAVTSRRANIQAITESWLKSKDCDVFEQIIFATTFDEMGQKRTRSKAEICQEIAATHLIDDQPKHCRAVAEVGVTALLFGTYGWHRGEHLPEGVIRVANWREVLDYFHEAS